MARNFYATVLTFALLIVFSTETVGQTSIAIPISQTPTKQSNLGFLEAYGRVVYSVEDAFDGVSRPDADGASVDLSLQNFLRDQVTKVFGGSDGSYTLTLALLSGSQVIAKRAILSFSWRQKRFLFFTAESSLVGSLSRSGVLADNFPVSQSNNTLNVQIRLQKNSSIFVDTETFNEFSEQASLLQFSSLQPALELLPSYKETLGVMSAVLDTTEEIDITNDVAMRFIARGTDAPSTVTWSINGPFRNKSGNYRNGINVVVKFETEDSLFDDFENGAFTSQDLSTALRFAIVGTSSAALPFGDSISAKRYDVIRGYLASLELGTFPQDATPNSVCRTMWRTLLDFFSINDAPLIYAAYVQQYAFELDQPNAKRSCIDQYQQTFDRLGIDVNGIAIGK